MDDIIPKLMDISIDHPSIIILLFPAIAAIGIFIVSVLLVKLIIKNNIKYQIMKMSSKIYAVDVSDLDQDERDERIEDFISQGTPVIITLNLDDLQDFDIYEEDITIVELD